MPPEVWGGVVMEPPTPHPTTNPPSSNPNTSKTGGGGGGGGGAGTSGSSSLGEREREPSGGISGSLEFGRVEVRLGHRLLVEGLTAGLGLPKEQLEQALSQLHTATPFSPATQVWDWGAPFIGSVV